MKYVLSILLLLAAIVVISSVTAQYFFGKKVESEVAQLYQDVDVQQGEVLTREDLQGLPVSVQKWLERSGVVGKEKIKSVRLKQTGSMRTDAEKAWMPFTAEQYFNYEEPGFIWHATIKAAPLVHINGRDRYFEGKGNMLIKVMSLLKVADGTGKEMDQGSLVRYLAETMWQPSAALQEYIEWEEIDAQTARATMTYGGISASGIFFFDSEGNITNFSAKRYRDLGDGSFSMDDWYITINACKEFNGIRIPSEAEVMWKLPEGDFPWLKLKITDMEYNRMATY